MRLLCLLLRLLRCGAGSRLLASELQGLHELIGQLRLDSLCDHLRLAADHDALLLDVTGLVGDVLHFPPAVYVICKYTIHMYVYYTCTCICVIGHENEHWK